MFRSQHRREEIALLRCRGRRSRPGDAGNSTHGRPSAAALPHSCSRSAAARGPERRQPGVLKPPGGTEGPLTMMLHPRHGRPPHAGAERLPVLRIRLAVVWRPRSLGHSHPSGLAPARSRRCAQVICGVFDAPYAGSRITLRVSGMTDGEGGAAHPQLSSRASEHSERRPGNQPKLAARRHALHEEHSTA